MCPFQAPSMALNLSHLRIVHSSDSRFRAQCGIGGCTYTGRSFSSLYSHIYRKHPDSGVIQKRRMSQGEQLSTSVSLPTVLQQGDDYDVQGESMDTGKW